MKDMPNGQPSTKEDLVRIDEVINSIALFVEVESSEVSGRCSLNRRAPEAADEREFERSYVRKSLAEKHATGMLLSAMSSAGLNELSGYSFVAGYVVRDDALLKDVKYYLSNALLTKWDHLLLAEKKEIYHLPSRGLNGIFDPTRIVIFGFSRKEIAALLDRSGVKHSLLPKIEVFNFLTSTLLASHSSLLPIDTNDAKRNMEAPKPLDKVKRRKGPVANLDALYQKARKRAIDKDDFQSVKTELLNIVEAGEGLGLLIAGDEGLVEVVKNTTVPFPRKKYKFNKLSNWLSRLKKKESKTI